MALIAIPRNLNEEANLNRIVSNPNPLDSDFSKFTDDGVFSKAIFGNLSNSNDWSCNCGHLEGEFNKGITCTTCYSKVEYKGLMLDREGWIDLAYPIIHPLFYRYISKVIGPTALGRMLAYKAEIKVEGQIIETPIEYPYTNIGITNFITYFDEILRECFEHKKNTHKEYKFIMEHRDLVFINYFPVINSKLRPAIIIDGEFSFDAINNLYNSLIQNANLLNNLSSIEKNPLNIEALCYKNQCTINEIYGNILDNLSKKEGYIRSTLFG